MKAVRPVTASNRVPCLQMTAGIEQHVKEKEGRREKGRRGGGKVPNTQKYELKAMRLKSRDMPLEVLNQQCQVIPLSRRSIRTSPYWCGAVQAGRVPVTRGHLHAGQWVAARAPSWTVAVTAPNSVSKQNSVAYGTRRFNAAFTTTLQYSLSLAESLQLLVSIPISLRSILILSSQLLIGLPKGLFLISLVVKIFKILIPSSILATWTAHLNPPDLITLIILCSHLRLGFPKCLFPVGSPVKIYKPRVPSSFLVTWPAHLNLGDLFTLIILSERHKLWSSSLWSS